MSVGERERERERERESERERERESERARERERLGAFTGGYGDDEASGKVMLGTGRVRFGGRRRGMRSSSMQRLLFSARNLFL